MPVLSNTMPLAQYQYDIDAAHSVDDRVQTSLKHYTRAKQSHLEIKEQRAGIYQQYVEEAGLKKRTPGKKIEKDLKHNQEAKIMFVGMLATAVMEYIGMVAFLKPYKFSWWFLAIFSLLLTVVITAIISRLLYSFLGSTDELKMRRAYKILLVSGVTAVSCFVIFVVTRLVDIALLESLMRLTIGLLIASSLISSGCFFVLHKYYSWFEKYVTEDAILKVRDESFKDVEQEVLSYLRSNQKTIHYLSDLIVVQKALEYHLLGQDQAIQQILEQRPATSNKVASFSQRKELLASSRNLSGIILLIGFLSLSQTGCNIEEKIFDSDLVTAQAKVDDTSQTTNNLNAIDTRKTFRPYPTVGLVAVDASGSMKESVTQYLNTSRKPQLADWIIDHQIIGLSLYHVQSDGFAISPLYHLAFEPFPQSITPSTVEPDEFSTIFAKVSQEQQRRAEAEATQQTKLLISNHEKEIKGELNQKIKELIPACSSSKQTDLNGVMAQAMKLANGSPSKVLMLLISDGGHNAANGENNSKRLKKIEPAPENLEVVVLLVPEKNIPEGQSSNAYTKREREIKQAWPFAKVEHYNVPSSISSLFIPNNLKVSNIN